MTDHTITETDIKLQLLLEDMCSKEPAAISWMRQLREAIMFFDHVYDNDGNTPKEEIISVMRSLTVDWGLNSFYKKYSEILSVVISNAISAWQFSNIENMPKFKSYDIYGEIASTVCLILHGRDGMDKYMPEIRELTYKLYLEDEDRDQGKK